MVVAYGLSFKIANGGTRQACALHTDFDASRRRAVALRARDPAQTRRLRALASIYDGGSRTEAARIGGVTRQIRPGLGAQVK